MKKIKSEQGSFLIGALVFVIILGIVIFSVTTLVTSQNRAQVQSAQERKAFYAAETGIEYAVAAIKDSCDWRASVSNSSVGDGEFSIKVDDENTMASFGDTILVTSTGYYRNIQRTLQLYLLQFNNGPALDYVVLADDDIDFSSGKAIIDGNLHANGELAIGSNYIINGSVSQAPPVVDMPIIDWDFFKNEASNLGQYVEGNKAFVGGSTYTGVWYITGKATVLDNDIQVKGTIVSEDDCELIMNNESIIADPGYPAILTKGDLIVQKNGATIRGLIYCKNLDIQKNNMKIYGAIITTGTIINQKNNTEFYFDPTSLTGLEGMDFGCKKDSLMVLRWQN